MHPRDRIEFRIDALKAAGRWREPRDAVLEHTGTGVDARSNDYLGYARQSVPRETTAPLGAGASRLISGTHAQHTDLERTLSGWLGFEDCLLFSSGYAANVGAISALAGPGETILSDELNHASIIDGCRLSRAEVIVLPHRNLGALEQALTVGQGVRWVVTESYFGMDADSPDLSALRRLCDIHGAALIVDEAHALGVFGPEGRGIAAQQGVTPDVMIGGLGKALGLHGGFAASSELYRDWLWNRARSFVFSTAPSPVLCALALDRVEQVRRADPERERLRQLELVLVQHLQRARIEIPSARHGPVFPIVLGTESAAMAGAARARELGVLCHPVRPPTVPAKSSRLRVSLRADMSEADVARIGQALEAAWRERASEDGCESQSAAVDRPMSAQTPSSRSIPTQRPDPITRTRNSSDLPNRPLPSPDLPTDAVVTRRHRSDAASLRGTRWIVLGTGTGVGKTFVTRELLRALATANRPAIGLKPIETGLSPNIASDARELDALAFRVQPPDQHPLYAFSDPVTPARAARTEGVSIDLTRISDWVNAVEATAHPSTRVVIETAGGVFSPISDEGTNFDLALTLGPARWILVAPNRLGVLHDVGCALRAMTALRRLPDWIILSATETPDSSTSSNLDELSRLLPSMPPVLELPRNDASPLAALLRGTPEYEPASSDQRPA